MVRMVGKLFCICLHFVNRGKENTLKEREDVHAGDAEQTSSVFMIDKPGETKAAIPVSLINRGSQHGRGCSFPGCCVGEEQSTRLSAVGDPRMGGLQHHGLGLLPVQGRQEQGGPHSFRSPPEHGVDGCIPLPRAVSCPACPGKP